MKKSKKIGIIFIILLALVVGYYVIQSDASDRRTSDAELRQALSDANAADGIFRSRYGNNAFAELRATVGEEREALVVVAELIQKYQGREIGSAERKDLETLLAQTGSDDVKDVIRFLLQRNDIRVNSREGAYQSTPGVPTVTIEPLITPIYSHFDGYRKVTRVGGDISEPLFVDVVLSGARGTWGQIHIPAGESEYIDRDTMHDIEGDVVTYTITGCGRRSPACDYTNYSSEQCTPKTIPCHIGNPSTATFHFAVREEEPVVSIKPVATPVSDPGAVAFEITRTGDISKYLGILLDCRLPGSYPEPLADRALMPAGTRTMVHSYPLTSATSVTCYVGTGETGEHVSDQATVEVVREGE